MIVTWITVRYVAAERALVADLRIRNQARGFDEQRTFLLHERRPNEIVLGRHRADVQLLALFTYAS